MSVSRLTMRALRTNASARTFTTSAARMASKTTQSNSNPGNAQEHSNTNEYRDAQKQKELNPHMTNSNSTFQQGMPKAGVFNAPPEMLSATDGKFIPRDSVADNTDRMVGGRQNPSAQKEDGTRIGGDKRKVEQREWNRDNGDGKGVSAEARSKIGLGEVAEGGEGYKGGGSYVNHTDELQVGELEGGSFKIEPLLRTGEDAATMRQRLLYQSRKRGTLESDLLMSTFADAHLKDMSIEQMREYSLFLDENDWDIYYWATQEPQDLELEQEKQGKDMPGAYVGTQGDASKPVAPAKGEWAQTIGTFKPLYRPVPERWRGSEILKRIRKHVLDRSAGGVVEGAETGSKEGGGGMAFMPAVKNFDGQ